MTFFTSSSPCSASPTSRPSHSSSFYSIESMDRTNSNLNSFKNIFHRKGSKHDTSNKYQAQLSTGQPNMSSFTSTPGDEPPPAYSQTPAAASSYSSNTLGMPVTHRGPAHSTVVAPASSVANTAHDEQLQYLHEFDTLFLIDDSSSMTLEGRWSEVSHILAQITPVCTKYDADGIDIKFLNAKHKSIHDNVTSPATVVQIFRDAHPSGGTPIAKCLAAILRPYMRKLEESLEAPKPINIIVITDGVPTDDPEGILLQTAKKLDVLDAVPWQVGVQFLQVGSDSGARAYLARLDDGLKDQGDGCRDIVDTVPYRGRLDEETMLKVVLGGVNKRHDRLNNPGDAPATRRRIGS